MTKVFELKESEQPSTEETTIVIKSSSSGVNMIRINNSKDLEVKGKIKETFEKFLELDKMIKDIDHLIEDNRKEQERLRLELSKYTEKLKRIASDN